MDNAYQSARAVQNVNSAEIAKPQPHISLLASLVNNLRDFHDELQSFERRLNGEALNLSTVEKDRPDMPLGIGSLISLAIQATRECRSLATDIASQF